jgi:excisionase family DNA binding protein
VQCSDRVWGGGVSRRPRPAPVPGPAAWVLVTFLQRQKFGDWLPGVLSQLRPEDRAELLEALTDLELLSEEFKAWLASDLGTSELPTSAPAALLPHEIGAREAASMLRVSDRRVRQMCADGVLEARRDGWSWSIDRASVKLHQLRVA